MKKLAFILLALGASISPAFSVAASALEISTLGTSITAGNRWQPMVQRALERCGVGQVSMSNYGKAGQTIAWGIENIARAVEHKPDILIVEFAINDARSEGGVPLEESE